jgi:hypothetical protein
MIKMVLGQKQANDSWNVRQELVKIYVSRRYGEVPVLLY